MNVENLEDTIVLRLLGKVIPTPGKLRKKVEIFEFEENRVDFNNIYFGKKVSRTIEFKNSNSQKQTIEVQKLPKYIKVNISPVSLEPEQRGTIKVTFNSKIKAEYGNDIDQIRFTMKNENSTTTGVISIVTNVTEDFSKLSKRKLAKAPIIVINEKVVDFGEVKLRQKKKVEIQFENKGKRKLIIRNIKINNGLITLEEYDKIVKPGKKGKIIFSAYPTEQRNNLRGKIEIISNDPAQSKIILTVQAKVPQIAAAKSKTEFSINKYNIDLKKATNLIESGKDKLVILDVRTKKEFDEGHLENAINIDLSDRNFSGMLKKLDREKTYLVYCAKGYRSEEAMMIMHKLKFNNIFHMRDGYIGWEKYNKFSGKPQK